jgi:hypothetical protein
MAGPPPPRPVLPRTHYPAWGPARRGPASAWLLAWLACIALLAVGALAGLWFLPFAVGLGTGLAAHAGRLRLRTALTAVVVAAAAGWGAALAWLTLRDGLPEPAVARTIAALGGLPAQAAAGIAATLVVAVIQAVAGLWLGRALAPGHAR